jgi:hypothetical protein
MKTGKFEGKKENGGRRGNALRVQKIGVSRALLKIIGILVGKIFLYMI